MSRLTFSVIATAAALALNVPSAHAVPWSGRLSVSLPDKATAKMVEVKADPTPMGYVMFCMNYIEQCKPGAGKKRVTLNDDTWQMLNAVNQTVNDRIRPDAAKGFFEWSLTTTSGNCNDYAVQKRKELIDRGISPSALSLSVVVTEKNQGHLILTVRTDRGDFILDNLRTNIVAWNATGYRWVRVQSSNNPNQWVKIDASS